MLTVAALTYNFIAVLIAAVSASEVDNVASSIVFAVIYLVVGIPGAWVTWYQRLYRAMIYDGATSFATFFFFFMIHIAFAVWSALSPGIGSVDSDFAHTGLFRALEFFKNSGAADRLAGVILNHTSSTCWHLAWRGAHRCLAAGILFLIGAALWATVATLSFFYLFRVYKFFRTSGAEDRARAEVQQAAVRGGVQLARG